MSASIYAASMLGIFASFIGVFLGLTVAFRAHGLIAYALCGVMTIAILALGLSTQKIMSEKDLLHRIIRAFWVLAFPVGVYALYLAFCRHVIMTTPPITLDSFFAINWDIDWNQIANADIPQKICVYLSILFIIASPIAHSYIVHRSERQKTGMLNLGVKPPSD